MADKIDTLVVELIPKCYDEFEKLCVRTAFDYIAAIAGLSPSGLTNDEKAVMELNSVLICQLVRNIIAIFTAEMTTTFHNCTDSSDMVLAEFTKAISGFLTGVEFRNQLRGLVNEMLSTSGGGNPDLH